MTNTFFDAVRARAERAPEAVFLHLPDGRAVAYADMMAASARFANAVAALGVRPGDRVCVQVEKSADNLMLYLGCLRAGAAYLPLNTAYTLAELGYFIADAEPALIVCPPETEDALNAAGTAGAARVVTLGTAGEGSMMEAVAAAPEDFADADRDEGDLASILYTSGTTGRSKGAMLSHGNLLSNAETLARLWRFTASDRLLHALPIFHIHGLFVATNTVLMAGASMIFLPRFDAGEVAARLREATVLMGVPTFYTRLLSEPGLDRAAAARMRLFISGSAPLMRETFAAFAERAGHAILERYGMTETGMNTSNPYDGERVPGTVGLPLPDVELRVSDAETGAVLPQGEVGVIEVKGPNVFSGYWRMEEKTREAFRDDGFFVTGDLARIDARGYVHIVGRARDLIISGGLNVYPREVELELDALPGVAESAVIGLAHLDFGEAVTAVVVPEAGAAPSEATLLAALGERLARYKQPKRILFADALPRNAMGKVQKEALRRAHAGLYGAGAQAGA